MKPFIQRHSLLSYFALTFGITWGSILTLLATREFDFAALGMPDVMLMFLFMLLGPSISGLLLTGRLEGRQGVRELWQRQTRWRIGIQWYAVALFTVPVLLLSILLSLRFTVSPSFAPGFEIVGLMIGLMAGGLEEIGWTGFATPRLLRRYNPFRAGLLLGLVWALWHMLADYAGNIATMALTDWLTWAVLFWVLPLSAYRILMTWVYSRTHSLLVAQLMHASYTGWLLVLSPAISFAESPLWQIIFTASLWALVAAVGIFDRRWRREERPTAPRAV